MDQINKIPNPDYMITPMWYMLFNKVNNNLCQQKQSAIPDQQHKVLSTEDHPCQRKDVGMNSEMMELPASEWDDDERKET